MVNAGIDRISQIMITPTTPVTDAAVNEAHAVLTALVADWVLHTADGRRALRAGGGAVTIATLFAHRGKTSLKDSIARLVKAKVCKAIEFHYLPDLAIADGLDGDSCLGEAALAAQQCHDCAELPLLGRPLVQRSEGTLAGDSRTVAVCEPCLQQRDAHR